MKNNNSIKNDLYKLYLDIYNLSKTEVGYKIFNKTFLKKIKYKPEEIEDFLFNVDKKDSDLLNINCKINKLEKKVNFPTSYIRKEILDIHNKDDVRKYLEENIFVIYKDNIVLEEKNKVLRSISLVELRYLYKITFEIDLPKNIKKNDILQAFRSYYNNMDRTIDLSKNL